MEKAFEDLKKQGKNSVDGLIDWMKASNVIDKAKESEERARKLFEGAEEKKNVELKKFKEVLTEVAKEQKQSMDDMSKKLADEGGKFLEALKAGAAAFSDYLKKK